MLIARGDSVRYLELASRLRELTTARGRGYAQIAPTAPGKQAEKSTNHSKKSKVIRFHIHKIVN